MKRTFVYQKELHLVKKDIYLSEKEFITLDRLRKGLHVEKKDNYFSEKEFDFRPAMLATMRKGLQVMKTDNTLAKRSLIFVLPR